MSNGKLFGNLKGVRIHTEKTHHDLQRKAIAIKYNTNDITVKQTEIYDIKDEYQQNETSMNDKIARDIDEWVRNCSIETNNLTFCLQAFQFLKFVSNVIHELSGPKHSARKYFEMRNKRKKILQNRT